MKTIAQIIGENIRDRRTYLRMGQHELADIIKVNFSTVSYWERGLNCPNALYLIALADALECSTDELCGRTQINQIKLIRGLLVDKSKELKHNIQNTMVRVDGEYKNVPEMLVGERAGVEYALFVIDQVERGKYG